MQPTARARVPDTSGVSSMCKRRGRKPNFGCKNRVLILF